MRSSTGTITLDSTSITYHRAGQQPLHALSRIDLEIRSREFFSITGPSGCGKTTILNSVAGFLKPSTGAVLIDGEIVTGPGPDRAVVFQDDAVFPWMTVAQNVGFSPRARGKDKEEIAAIVGRYLRLVGLEEFRNVWPAQLSGGMRKRVDLARGFAADPDVLLLDEPFGSLDILTKEYLQEELQKLWLLEPRTVVLVTHDVEEALFLSDRVALMTPRPGRIAAVYDVPFGRPREASLRTSPDFVSLRRAIRDVQSRTGRGDDDA